MATIAVADYVILRRPPRCWHAIALFDHPAHVATAALVGGTDPLYLAGSLLPDVDHVPMAFRAPMPGDPRPNTHSVVVLAAAALVSRRLAAGMTAHFARDLALDPGVPILWPLTREQFTMPYALYAGALMAAAVLRGRGGSAGR